MDGVNSEVVGTELTIDDWLVDDTTDVGVTTLVVGLLTCGDDDTLDCIEETIVVGTDTLDDGAVLLEGDE